MASLRQRLPFRFSEDNDDDNDRILDEQEQEELIYALRKEHWSAWAHASATSHLVLLLSMILQIVYVFKRDKTPLLYAILPGSIVPSPTKVYNPNLFALLNLCLHNNLIFQKELPPGIPDSYIPLYKRYLPLPILHPVSVILTLLAPALVLFRGGSWPDFAWWCITPAMSWLIWSIQRWDAQASEELANLERLRYNAKGA